MDLQLFARIENGPKLPPRWALLLAKLWALISEDTMSEYWTPTTYFCLETVWGWVGLALTCFISLLIGTWSLWGMKRPWLCMEYFLKRLGLSIFPLMFLLSFESEHTKKVVFGMNKVMEEIVFWWNWNLYYMLLSYSEQLVITYLLQLMLLRSLTV